MMRRNGRYLRETVAIMGVLLLIVLLAAWQLTQPGSGRVAAAGASDSSSQGGTDLLFGWLGQRGYRVTAATEQLAPSSESVLFVISPEANFSTAEVAAVSDWVRGGGTLVIAQAGERPSALLRHFDVGMRRLWRRQETATLSLPTLGWPLVGSVQLNARHRLELDCRAAAVHLGDCTTPLLVSFGWGNGQVFLMSTVYPLTNAGLRRGSNAQLVQNLIDSTAPLGSTILVDEAHRVSLLARLGRAPATWALLLLATLLLLYSGWHSQPFGQRRTRQTAVVAMPSLQTTTTFINQMAQAQRELDETSDIRDHYWQRLKRKVAFRHGLDPGLPDAQFLAAVTPHEDETTMSRLIYLETSKKRPFMSEQELWQWTTSILEMMEPG